jgi:hypothetical protein
MLNTFIDLKDALKYINRNITNTEFQDIYLSNVDWFITKNFRTVFSIFTKLSIKL